MVKRATSLPPPGSVIASAAIFALEHGAHEALLLLFGAEPDDRRQRDAVAAEPDGGADRVPGEDHLVGRDEHVGEVAARAAERLGIADAGDAAAAAVA